MSKRTFYLLLLVIVALGLWLRLTDYSHVPPWRESDDEIHYAWAGLTWLTKGVPTSWSRFSSYPESKTYNAWNVKWRLVTPMLEKPPLYIFLSGLTAFISGTRELDQVRLTSIRFLPIVLSVFTILFVGLVEQNVFGDYAGLLGALLYAVTPTIVLSNRLSVTENLLTPLSLVALYVFFQNVFPSFWQASPSADGERVQNPHHAMDPGQTRMTNKKIVQMNIKLNSILLGLIAGLAALTKQSGITVIIAFGILYAYQKRWHNLCIFLFTSLLLASIYPLIGFLYNGKLFLTLMSEARRIGVQGGLPELLYTIVGRPLIGTEKLFPDGTVLLGYLLLLISPWWLLHDKKIDWQKISFLAFPFTYLLYLGLTITGAEKIGSGQGFWGWYAYPLFPYLIILVSFVMVEVYKNISIYKLIIILLTLGSSTIRFSFLFLPRDFHYHWQQLMFLLLGVMVSSVVLNSSRRKIILWGLLFVFLGVNLYTSLHLSQMYPSLSQP